MICLIFTSVRLNQKGSNTALYVLDMLNPSSHGRVQNRLSGLVFGSNRSHFHHILRRMFHSDIFFSRTATSWNWLPRGCSPDHDHVSHFKSNVNQYLSSLYAKILISYHLLFNSYHNSLIPTILTVTLYHEGIFIVWT